MELKPKFQKSEKRKKEREEMKKENTKSSRREERLEKTPSFRKVNPLPENDMMRNVNFVICRYKTIPNKQTETQSHLRLKSGHQ